MINLDDLNLAAYIDDGGIHAPDYPTIKATLESYFMQIYGADIYIAPDSKDGQLLAIFAKAIHDTNNTLIDVYNSFSPSKATGEALSSNVKINGIRRHASSYSQSDVIITGDIGTIINNGVVRDKNSILWDLPSRVTIGVSGQETVTVTCQQIGSIAALSNSITEIATPTRGWKSVTNPKSATTGQPVETDAELYYRQTISVALPSKTVLEGIVGAVADIDGVVRHRAYENDSSIKDTNGLPPPFNSLSR